MSAATGIDPLLTVLVARARNGVIGRDNQLPWRLPEDLRHFKATTLGHVLIMGRLTFESIGRPLPGRTTLVLTRNPDWRAPGCLLAASLAEALATAHAQGQGEVFVVGGEQIYRQALPIAARVLVTEIELDVPGDAHFGPLPAGQWQETSRQAQTGADGTRFAIVDYRRR
ncbi:MAG: dihydrofolate reductase [Burkholderiales bacterium]|nr:dihydrofolate reductase [Burkholderiales bacterium]